MFLYFFSVHEQLSVIQVGYRAVALEMLLIHTLMGKIMNTSPDTHILQQRFEPVCAEFEKYIQTAVGERVGRLLTLTCNKELENMLKTSQNTEFILNKIYEQEIIF